MYIQGQDPNQVQANVNTAISFIQPALQALVSSGRITQQESATIYNALYAGGEITKFSTDIQTLFQATPVNQNAIWEEVVRKIQNAAFQLRQSMTATSPMSVTGMANQYGQVQMAPQQQIISTGFNPSNSAQSSLAAVYGNHQAQNQQMYSIAPTVNQGAVPSINQVAAAPEIKQPKKHTGQAYSIDLTDKSMISDVPVWKPIKNVDEIKKSAGTVIEALGNAYTVEFDDQKVQSCEIRVKSPVADAEELLTDLRVNASSLFQNKFIHVIDYEETVVAPVSFDQGRMNLNKVIDAFKNTNKDDISKIIASFAEIKGSTPAFQEVLSERLLEDFNNIASVNFINVTANGVSRLAPFSRIDDLARFFTDDGNPDYENWKADTEVFSQALTNTIKASVAKLYTTSGKHYLDPAEPKALAAILADKRIPIRVDGFKAREISLLESVSEETKQNLTKAVRTCFVFTIRKKIVVHNLKLPVDVGPRDYSPYLLGRGSVAKVLYQLFDKHGNVELVHVDDESQIQHPLLLGVTYNNELLVRRV